jgi:hypothetical protein
MRYEATRDVARIQTTLRTAQQAMGKYGSAATGLSLKGVDQSPDALLVQEAMSVAREHGDALSVERQWVVEHCDRVDALVATFVQHRSIRDLQENGREILAELSTLLVAVRATVNVQRTT